MRPLVFWTAVLAMVGPATSAMAESIYRYRDVDRKRDVFVNRLDQVPRQYRKGAEMLHLPDDATVQPAQAPAAALVKPAAKPEPQTTKPPELLQAPPGRFRWEQVGTLWVVVAALFPLLFICLFLIFPILIFVRRKRTGSYWLRTVELGLLAAFAGFLVVEMVLIPYDPAVPFLYWIVAAIEAPIAALDARSRCEPRHRWAVRCFLLPFAMPFVLMAKRVPNIAGHPASELVAQFGAMFAELVEAETRRRMEQRLPLDSTAVAEMAVAGARNFIALEHRLSPSDSERVVGLYARSASSRWF